MEVIEDMGTEMKRGVPEREPLINCDILHQALESQSMQSSILFRSDQYIKALSDS